MFPCGRGDVRGLRHHYLIADFVRRSPDIGNALAATYFSPRFLRGEKWRRRLGATFASPFFPPRRRRPFPSFPFSPSFVCPRQFGLFFPSSPPSLPRLLLPLLPLRPPEPSPPLVDGLRTTAEGGREALLPFFAPSSLVNGVRPCGGGGDSWLPPPPPPDPSQSCVCGGPLTNDCLTRSVGRGRFSGSASPTTPPPQKDRSLPTNVGVGRGNYY